MNQNTVNKVEVKCPCGVRHVVKINGRETPCKCGAGIKAIWVGADVQPFADHAPDRFIGKKPKITKWIRRTGTRINEPRQR